MRLITLMDATARPLSKRQSEQLRGYVAWAPTLFRVTLFFAAVGAVGWVLRTAHASLAKHLSHFRHDVWWMVPTLVFAAWLYRTGSRWTGGRSFRAKVRSDLAQGIAAVRRIAAVDAIEVDEREDEGHAYFVKTEDGKTLLFAGQYIEKYRRKGFPWKAFEIVEAPASGVFFDIVPCSDRLIPSFRRPPFTWEELKRFGGMNENYVYLDVDFDILKTSSTSE